MFSLLHQFNSTKSNQRGIKCQHSQASSSCNAAHDVMPACPQLSSSLTHTNAHTYTSKWYLQYNYFHDSSHASPSLSIIKPLRRVTVYNTERKVINYIVTFMIIFTTSLNQKTDLFFLANEPIWDSLNPDVTVNHVNKLLKARKTHQMSHPAIQL